MGTCNLAHEVYPELSINEEPVLVRLFKVGWHGIEQIPKQGLAALRQALSQLAVSNQDKGRKWVIQQVCDDLNRPSLDANIETRQFKAVHDNLDLLSLIYDAETVSRLKHLINDTPCWSESSGLRFIRCQDDLKQVAKYLKDLAMR